MNYVLINKMTTKPGKRQEVIAIMLEAGISFNDNSACLLYLVSGSKDDPNAIWVQDVWTNQADHEAAMQTETMMRYIKKTIPLLEDMPEQFQVVPAGGKSDWL